MVEPRRRAQTETPAPFAAAAADLARRGLAVLPCPAENGKSPKGAVRGFHLWRGPPTAKQLARLLARWPAANIGIVTGPSGVTVVDVDDPALIAPMLRRFGPTPLMTATPRGGAHLWYRAGGERPATLRPEGLAVDIQAGSKIVVVPPSIRPQGRHAGIRYRLLCGAWDDLPRLPPLRPGGLSGQAPGIVTRLGAVAEGVRNDHLFRLLLREAQACDTLDALRDVAHSLNADFAPPLAETEVEKIARSAWSYETDPAKENWAGKEQRIQLSKSEFQALAAYPDALALLLTLRFAQGPERGPRAIAPKPMAAAEVVPGWRHPRRYAKARDRLIAEGYLERVHKGGRGAGDPSLYRVVDRPGDRGRAEPPI